MAGLAEAAGPTTRERASCPSLLAANWEAQNLQLSPAERQRLDELYARFQLLTERTNVRRPERVLVDELRRLAPLASLYAPLLQAIREGNTARVRELGARIRPLFAEFEPKPEEQASAVEIEGRFDDRELERFVSSGEGGGRFPWSRYRRIVLREIHKVLKAKSLDEVKEVCGGIKHYHGGAKYAGWYAVEADLQWRVLFQWEGGRATQIFVVDYHND